MFCFEPERNADLFEDRKTVSSNDTLFIGGRKHAISKEEINKTETKFKQIHSNYGVLKINTDVLNY